MIYARILVIALIVLLLVYYVLTIGQAFGLWRYTYKTISLRGFIPFYYWFNL